MLRGFFLIFLLTGVAIVACLRLSRAEEHRVADRSFPRHGAPAESARAGAARIFCGWPRRRVSRSLGLFRWVTKCRKPNGASPGRAPAPSGDEGATASRLQRRERIIITLGRWATNWGTGLPMQVTAELMERGEQRFNINCAVCHGTTAAGNGITKQYGLTTVVSLQDERIRKMADGEIFNTITHGKNTMLAYGPNVTVTRSLGDHRLFARAATQPKRHRTCRRIVPTWKPQASESGESQEMSERSDVVPTPEGEYFENEPLCRLVVLLGDRRGCGSGLERGRRVSFSGINSVSPGSLPSPFSSRSGRLLFLDHRPSRDRCGMVGRRSAAAGKHRPCSCRSWRCSLFRSFFFGIISTNG